MKVTSMLSTKGNFVPNQFIITDGNKKTFQSYSSIIAENNQGVITLDRTYWNYSRTTSRYLAEFLNQRTADIKRLVKSGVYKLDNLN